MSAEENKAVFLRYFVDAWAPREADDQETDEFRVAFGDLKATPDLVLAAEDDQVHRHRRAPGGLQGHPRDRRAHQLLGNDGGADGEREDRRRVRRRGEDGCGVVRCDLMARGSGVASAELRPTIRPGVGARDHEKHRPRGSGGGYEIRTREGVKPNPLPIRRTVARTVSMALCRRVASRPDDLRQALNEGL
jgi:hypothetical protein